MKPGYFCSQFKSHNGANQMTPELAINIAIAAGAIGGALSALAFCIICAAYDATLRPRRISRRAARRAAFFR